MELDKENRGVERVDFGENSGSMWSVCRCGCHENRNIVHAIACCHKCKMCKKNIAGELDRHMKDKHPETLRK